jgi:uncharacterized membrane protein YhfC
METPLRALNALLMILLPVALAAALRRRYRVPWSLVGWGAVTFIGAQLVHVPLLGLVTLMFRGVSRDPFVLAHALLINAVILGLAAGVCEEGARWAGYRWLVPWARRWPEGLMLGAGHGGAEAVILGALAGWSLFSSVDAGLVGAGRGLMPLLGSVERVSALADHLALSVLVLQVFVRGRLYWLAVAVGWHALLDGVAVYVARLVSPVAVEGILALFGAASVLIVIALRREPEAAGRS